MKSHLTRISYETNKLVLSICGSIKKVDVCYFKFFFLLVSFLVLYVSAADRVYLGFLGCSSCLS